MSQRALLEAVRDHLRAAAPTGLAYTADQCEITPEGQPLPRCGEFFVGIWGGSWNNQADECLDEYFGVNITVTVRLPKVPFDRFGSEILIKAQTGLYARLEQIRANLHSDPNNYDVVNRANTILGAPVNGFVEPLRFRDGGRLEYKGPSWFFSPQQEPLLAGLAQTLTFAEARRVQTIESQA